MTANIAQLFVGGRIPQLLDDGRVGGRPRRWIEGSKRHPFERFVLGIAEIG